MDSRNMILYMRRASLLFLLTEIIVIAATIIASWPAHGGAALFAMSPSLISISEVAAFALVGVAAILYAYSAVTALLGKPQFFWSTYVPSMVALPISIWGYLKTLAVGGLSLVTLAVICGCLTGLLSSRIPDLLRRVIPSIAALAFLATADYRSMGALHLYIGTFLLLVPLSGGTRLPRSDSK